MIRIALTTHPRGGTITLPDVTHELATWHRAGPGYLLGTTTDGQRVTLATEDEDEDGRITGSITIGNTAHAPQWTIWRATKSGAVLTGQAHLVPSDWEMAGMFPGCGWDEV
jgi:hypothetical protein